MYIKDDLHASYELLKIGFIEKGYRVLEVTVDGHKNVVYTSPTGKVWQTRVSRIAYPFVSEEMRQISRNKEVAYKLVAGSGVSIPHTVHISPSKKISAVTAKKLLSTYPKLIVKPSDASLSKGLTLDIGSREELDQAIANARQVSSAVLIQEQVEGEEVRFTLIGGKVVAALLRRTPRVVGDGVSTIAELIKEENRQRAALKFEYLAYPQLDASIIDQDFLTSNTVPKKNEVVEFSRSTMVKNGCSVYNILEQIHPSYIETIEKLAAQLGTAFVVVDVFVKDFTKPRKPHNYWFIEFNTSPVLKLFYACRDGRNYDIVTELVDSIDEFLHQDEHAERQVFGSFEPVYFPDFIDETLIAKIDTGAYTGALHATNVRKKTDELGRKYLSFALMGDKKRTGISYDFYKRKVRSAHGHARPRYVIKLKLKIKDTFYDSEIGLSDRSDMKFPVLIGRRFLHDHNILVDVIVNEELDYEKELLG